MTETTERFLQEIATRVGHDRVAELYLFPVLRQGGVEGAVAVVAAYPESQPSEESAAATPADEVAPLEPSDVEPAVSEADDGAAAEPADEAADSVEPEPVASDAGDATQASQSRPRARHIVYTARYRHTVKGTDRGRWAVEVVAEGDAPLVTVEEVVRGVVRRSGDAFQPERISGEQFRAIVPAPAAPGSVPA